ncbi:MAG TPA: MmcQ/YjbR family DNA-binding protein [Bryobacteraceae bacterium]|nr:MmcQ/YjbR family DNA-binding protein [Bryobacteraceae bacterium]
MTPEDFRRIALELPGAVESAHMNHPDFRVNNKIFATLGYPDKACAMIKLPPGKQREFVELGHAAFSPVKGAWGKQGATTVELAKAREDTVRAALTLAWQSTSQKKRR